MKHLFLLLFFLLGVTFFSPVFAGNNGEEEGEEIPLEIINPGSVGAGNSKVPYRPLIAFLDYECYLLTYAAVYPNNN